MPTHDEWMVGYWRQARDAWAAWETLSDGRVAVSPCVRLQMLQMAAEKVGKSYLIRMGQLDPEGARQTHVVFRRAITVLLHGPDQHRLLPEDRRARAVRRNVLIELAGAVDALSPQGEGPDNVEYPWASGERVIAPVDWNFSKFHRYYDQHGADLRKLVLHLFAEAARERP